MLLCNKATYLSQSGLRDDEDPVYGPAVGTAMEPPAVAAAPGPTMGDDDEDGELEGAAEGPLREKCLQIMAGATRWTRTTSIWLIAFFRMAGRHNELSGELAHREGTKSRSVAHRNMHWGGLQVGRANRLLNEPFTADELPNNRADQRGVLGAATNVVMDIYDFFTALGAGQIEAAPLGEWGTLTFWRCASRTTWSVLVESNEVNDRMRGVLSSTHALRDLCCEALIFAESGDHLFIHEADIAEHVEWALAHAICDPCLRDIVDKKSMKNAGLTSVYANVLKLARLFFKRVLGVFTEWPKAVLPLMTTLFPVIDSIIELCIPPEELRAAMAAGQARLRQAVALGDDVPDNPFAIEDYPGLLRDIWKKQFARVSSLARVVRVSSALGFASHEDYVAWATENNIQATDIDAGDAYCERLDRLWLPDAPFDYCMATLLLQDALKPHTTELGRLSVLPASFLWELLILRLDTSHSEVASAPPASVECATTEAIVSTQRQTAAVLGRNFKNRSSQDSGHKHMAVELKQSREDARSRMERLEAIAAEDRRSNSADTDRLIQGFDAAMASFADRILLGLTQRLGGQGGGVAPRMTPTAAPTLPPASPGPLSAHGPSAARSASGGGGGVRMRSPSTPADSEAETPKRPRA